MIWRFPNLDGVKVNTDGATCDSPGLAACASLFRGSRGQYIGSFSAFLGEQNSLYEKIMGVVLGVFS